MMLPQLGVCGGMPTPRKLSTASVRMAEAAMKVACTISGANRLGRMWRNRMAARAGRHRRLDVGLLADGQHQRAHQSHHARDFRDHDGDDDGAQAALSVAISAIASSTPGMAISPSMTRMISASTRRK